MNAAAVSIDSSNGLPLIPYQTVNATTGALSTTVFPSPVGTGAGQIAPATVNSLTCPTATIKGTTYQQALLPNQVTEFLSPYTLTDEFRRNPFLLRAGPVEGQAADAQAWACASTG